MSNYRVELKSGQTIFVCACSKTNNPPFCDGSHKGSGIRSIMYTSTEDKTVYLCKCGKSKTLPLCENNQEECKK